MTDRSAAELERQAEEVRAEMAETAESIRTRLTPGQMVDEMMGYFKGSDSSLALHNLKTQVRDNPMALALVGAGVAWLMSGVGSPAPHRAKHEPAGRDFGRVPPGGSDRRFRAEAGIGTPSLDPASPGSGGLEPFGDIAGTKDGHDKRKSGGASSYAERAADALGDAASTTRSAVGAAGDRVSDTLDDMRHGAREAGDYLRETGDHLRHEAGSLAGRSRDAFTDALDREPLVIGAIGLAVGAAIGAMLPSTRVEDEYLGPERERLKKEAGHALKEGFEEAKDVAGKAYSAASAEARDQGLVPEGRPLAQKVAAVSKAATHAAEDAAERKLADRQADKKPLPEKEN